MTGMIPGDPEIEPTDRENIEPEKPATLEQALADEKKRAEEYLSKWQRAQADFINLKRRSEQEKGEILKIANAELAGGILPVLDDLTRALEHIDGPMAEDNWVEGIRLIERKLRAGLESQGIREIKALGEKFDPNLHEAVMQEENDSVPHETILEELRAGYTLNGRLIRAAQVKVSRHPNPQGQS